MLPFLAILRYTSSPMFKSMSLRVLSYRIFILTYASAIAASTSSISYLRSCTNFAASTYNMLVMLASVITSGLGGGLP